MPEEAGLRAAECEAGFSFTGLADTGRSLLLTPWRDWTAFPEPGLAVEVLAVADRLLLSVAGRVLAGEEALPEGAGELLATVPEERPGLL